MCPKFARAIAPSVLCLLPAAVLAQQSPPATAPAPAPEPVAAERNLTELRDTIVNLLEALVQRGVITREQAQAMVRDAQNKAAAETAAATAKREQEAKEEAGAVRVPYVPQIVKDEISKEVTQQLGAQVQKEVVDNINSKSTLWAALPEWMRRITWTGDLRLREEGDLFASDNATGVYLNFNAVNAAGGVDKAGPQALLNVTNNEWRLRMRARFGFDADLGDGWSAAVRLATGSTGQIIATTNQTLGTYGAGYTTTLDQAYIRWSGSWEDGYQGLLLTGGRFGNPWISTDMLWYNDLTFEGIYGRYHWNFGDDTAHPHDVFVTLGGFPLQSFSLVDPNSEGRQKWLAGAQLGLDWHTDDESSFKLAAAYYDYMHIVGEKNAFDSSFTNWTAPAFVQKGNTMYDISNTTDKTVNLYALAANYRIADLIGVADFRVLSRYDLIVTAEALRNVGYKTADVSARVGSYVAPRTHGYRADVSFGTSGFDHFGAWRGSVGYRYVQRDAVLDAFNDEDFHLGGTDTKGYTLLVDFAFNRHVWVRAKYMSANEIDGPPLGIDVLQVDLNSQF